MFGFLKDKLKGALGKFAKDVEKETTVEKKEVIIEEKPSKKDNKGAKAQERKEPVKKEHPKPEKKEEKQAIKKEDKIVKKPEPVHSAAKPAKAQEQPKPILQSKDIESKQSKEKKSEVKVEERAQETVHIKEEPKKRSFFDKLFGKKEKEDIIEQKQELIEELEEEDIEPVFKDKQEKKPVITPKETKAKEHEDIKPKPKTVLKQKHEDIKSQARDKIHETAQIKEEAKVQPKETVEVFEEEEKPVEAKTVTIEEPAVEESRGFFTKITETFTKFNLSEEKFEELFWELELAMLENNVAVEVIDKIKADLKKELLSGRISRKGVDELIAATLKRSIEELFDVEKRDLLSEIKMKRAEGKPYIITIIGVNGSGKTTSIAKLTHMLQKQGMKVVLAASDTFRAAAIQQLEEHANNLHTKLIKHDYNSDPAAVGFDAIKYAEAKDMDVVIIDTAGRLHSNTNLMQELKKVIRVCNPDIKIFVGESITGNDCVEQAKEFDKAVGIDAIILAKADVDDKGGAAISVSYVIKKPILYLGVGQTYDDLKAFDSQLIIESLEL